MDFLDHLLQAPLANILILAGLCFLGVGAVGKITGKIEPDKIGRIIAGLLGLVLLVAGVGLYIKTANKIVSTQPLAPPVQPKPLSGGESPGELPTDFVSAVKATKPLAYFRLESRAGLSEVGDTTYSFSNGATISTPGAPIDVTDNHCAALNGRNGKVDTTQAGGIAAAGSVMIWMNLASLPSEGHIFYLAGESERHNDFDIQLETGGTLKFYTDGGDSIGYPPDPVTLVNHWHSVVATLDTASRVRALYWDGRLVRTDLGGGTPNKTSSFSIGESTVFTGRFFHGSIDEVALWNRALSGDEVVAIYSSMK